MRQLIMAAVLLLSALPAIQAQNFGEIKGKVIDAVTGEAVPLANVWVNDAGQLKGEATDFDGKFTIKPLSPGTYDLHVKDVRFGERVIQGVEVKPDEITLIADVGLSGNTLTTVDVITWIKPLIEPDNPTKMSVGAADLIKRSDRRDIGKMVVALMPGVSSGPEQQLYFRGARPENMATFVDGVKVIGGQIPNLPSNAIQNLTVYTGGIPASYGDITGGVVIIETKSYMDFYREHQRKLNRN